MKTGKKTHWLRNTLIVLVACGIAGLALAAVLYPAEFGRPYASAKIQFAYEKASEGKGPNGYSFDVSGIMSDTVLNAALEDAGLAGTYTAEQVRDNLNVNGVYPEKIMSQMTKYVSLLDSGASTLAAVSDYHPTLYSAALYNGFEPAASEAQLTKLLDCILERYRAYFAKTYSVSLSKAQAIADLPEYDYAQQLDAIREETAQQARYAGQMAELAPDYMADGKGFADIEARYENLDRDIERLSANVIMNVVSKDGNRLRSWYETEIRTRKYRLESLAEELKLIGAQVDAYEKEAVIYVSANGGLQKVGDDQARTYDKLVKKRKEITDEIASINATVTLYQARLDDMAGTAEDSAADAGEGAAEATAEKTGDDAAAQQAAVEEKIREIVGKKNAVRDDFLAMLDGYTAREINEQTVSVRPAQYKAAKLVSGSFIVKAVKTAGPLCALGFMVCMVLLIRSRRKEEKA